MLDFLKNCWGEILGILSLTISIFSIILSYTQNKNLHKDNKKLSSLPILEVEMLLHELIRGQIVKRISSIDEINVWESKYTPYYTHHDLIFDGSDNTLFTILIKNIGNGPAKNIIYKSIKIRCNDNNLEYSSNQILFSCSQNEIKANVVNINLSAAEVCEVEIVLEYIDVLGNIHTLKNIYAQNHSQKCEMQLLSSFEE